MLRGEGWWSSCGMLFQRHYSALVGCEASHD